MKMIRLIRTTVVEYIPVPDWYPEGLTIEQMAEFDMQANDREMLFDSNVSDEIVYEIFDDGKQTLPIIEFIGGNKKVNNHYPKGIGVSCLACMNIEEMKQDAFNKIKKTVDDNNLDITDKEIYKWIDDVANNMSDAKRTLMDTLIEEHIPKCLQSINDLTNSDFNKGSSLESILNVISNKWDSL